MYFRTGDRLAKIRFWPDDPDCGNLSFSHSSLQVCTEGSIDILMGWDVGS